MQLTTLDESQLMKVLDTDKISHREKERENNQRSGHLVAKTQKITSWNYLVIIIVGGVNFCTIQKEI